MSLEDGDASILLINALIDTIGNLQKGVEPTVDPELLYKMFGYRIDNTSYKLLAKGMPGKLLDLILTDQAGTGITALHTDNTGKLIGAPISTLSTGYYTPAPTSLSNVTLSDIGEAHWFRVGDIVTVYGDMRCTPVTPGLASGFFMDLPVTPASTPSVKGGSWNSYSENFRIDSFISSANFYSDEIQDDKMTYNFSYTAQSV